MTHSTDPEMAVALEADAAKLETMGADAGPTIEDFDFPPHVNAFERHPDLARWMERLSQSRIEGMSLMLWGHFCRSVNEALLTERNSDRDDPR